MMPACPGQSFSRAGKFNHASAGKTMPQPLYAQERGGHRPPGISRRAIEFLHFFGCRRHGTKVARDGGVPARLLARRSAGIPGKHKVRTESPVRDD